MGKMPAFQFYPGDWRKDVGVQSLDYFDRGVWHEMLCLMHESERRGVLVLNGHAMTGEMLARLLGLDKQTLTTTLTTLLTSGVASREAETGALMCRRMVRDEKLCEIRRQAGKLGGNPALLNQKPTTMVNHDANQTPTPSSSASSSVSSSKTELPEGAKNAPSSSNGKPSDPTTAVQIPDDGLPAVITEPTEELFSAPEMAIRERTAAVKEVFAYYLERVGRNPVVYTLSPLRMKKGLARLKEALRMAHGNLDGAIELMKAVVDEIAMSDFHMGRNPKTEGKSYCEWENHLFRSTEQFESWLQKAQEAEKQGTGTRD